MLPRVCPLCSSAEVPEYCRKGRYLIRRCDGCGNGYLDLAETPLDPSALYQEGYHLKPAGHSADAHAPVGYDDYYAMEPAFRRTFSARLSELLRRQPPAPGRSLLDIGCGPGFFLDLARPHYAVQGVELAPEAVAHARERLKLDVKQAPFDGKMFAEASFDAVTMFDTIEHVPDPIGALNGISRVLKPGGWVQLTTGDFSSLASRVSGANWHLLTPPDHLFYFTRGGLVGLMEKHGFEVAAVRYPYGHFTVDYLMERLVKSLRLGLSYRRLTGLRAALTRTMVPVNLWDIMLIEARKRG